MFAHNQPLLQYLRSQVAQGLLTREQAQERFTLSQTPGAHAFQEQDVPQQVPSWFTTGGMAGGSTQQQMVTYPQQQQHNAFASRVGQNLHPPGMGPPQGQGPLQQTLIQPSSFVPPANLQSSAAPFASQPTPLGGPTIHGLHKNFLEMPLPQLSNFYSQLMRAVENGEKNFPSSTGGESDMQRQALQAKLDNQKQLLINIRDLIDLKRQGGDPAQQAVNGAQWLGAGQRTTGLYSVPDRPPMNLVLSATAHSNHPQISPHVSSNGLPFNGAPPQAPYPPPQQTIQCSKLPPLPEARFKALFAQFANTTGLRLNDWDFVIDGRPVSPWALHRAVFARNGSDIVTANNEWPAVGAALGFPQIFAGDPTQPPHCTPTIAHRLQQLYNDSLRQFEQAYINNVMARLRSSQVLSQVPTQPSQQQAQPQQPTDADYQALLASIPSDSSVMTAEAINILPLFSHTCRAELEAHRVPSPIVAFVEQHRANLQRAAQDQNELLRGVTSTKNPPLTHPPQQPSVQPRTLPPLSEDQFKTLLTRFANATGIRPNYRDFVVDGRPISPWALHRAVFARNGFDSVRPQFLRSALLSLLSIQVTANDEWPAVGAAMGFPPQYAVEFGQPPRCGPITAHRLQQLYNDSLRHFDQDYINNVLSRPRDVDQVSARPPNERA
ncbi:hypothetical protein BJY52DRAFT_1188853 [Lactarius psammicola]|nr:hypothetical protein BJY52DRAFT_1188853 [Lactarius psammicola]